jgi:hypothetical protein
MRHGMIFSPLIKCNSGSKGTGFFSCMTTGPCQASFTGTHYYIYLGGVGEGGGFTFPLFRVKKYRGHALTTLSNVT